MTDVINGLGSYNQYNKTDSTSDKITSQLTNKDYANATDEELMDACRQFESYFVEQVIKSMEKMIPKSDDDDSTTGKYMDYFGDTMTQKLAETVTEQSNLGLAQMLYEQMKRNYSPSNE